MLVPLEAADVVDVVYFELWDNGQAEAGSRRRRTDSGAIWFLLQVTLNAHVFP